MIHLSVGRLEVDWGKNSIFSNHGAIYQNDDFRAVPSYYAGKDWPNGEPDVEMNEGLGKELGLVKDRLELLGYSIRSIEIKYNEFIDSDDFEGERIVG